jgi:glycosyltransferase involved in cell wall biosynthesis
MKILHAAPDYPPLVSGIPELARQISERLTQRGHEVHVATGAVKGSPATEVRNGVTVHRFNVWGNAAYGIHGEADAFLEFVRAKQWDVVVSQCAQIWSTDLLFNVQFDAPVVFAAHGLAYENPVYREYFGQLAAWLGHTKTMISCSAIGIEDGAFRRNHSLPDAVVIRNGVDGREWVTPDLGVRKAWGRDHEPWLLNVSVHSPAKSHNLLFELMAQLRSRKQGMHLTQIGRSHYARKWNLGKVGVRGGCYYSCRARALFEKSITLVQNTTREVTVSAIKEADIMVHPSNWEASPLVILDCMAAGIPFVAFDVGCIREHAGGRVVSSLSEMAEAVIELMNNPRLRQDLGEQGKRCVAERHDWERVVDGYEQLFNRLIAEKNPKLR